MNLLGLLLKVPTLSMPSRSVRVTAARVLLMGFAVGVAVSLVLPLNGADIAESIIGHGIAAVVFGGAGTVVFCAAWLFLSLVKFALDRRPQ